MNNQGFTLIEVLVATSIVIMVLVGISSGVSFAVKNTRFSQEKALSVRYAQEALEWVRSQRDQIGWQGFFSVLDEEGPNQFYYCLPSLPSDISGFRALTSQTTGDCSLIDGTSFDRRLQIVIVNGTEIGFTSTIVWQDASQQYETSLNTTLREWR